MLQLRNGANLLAYPEHVGRLEADMIRTYSQRAMTVLAFLACTLWPILLFKTRLLGG